ncbi:putative nucleoporin nup44 [Phaeomoniella chlamydospora]|uniref:Putative nucleoporin nup44 n=1 Tax=Phaeomoniella chlamydospora TaxID=158046 RepID=A0A0G2ETQ2_PHACM|nr:putative nucleoporin nup44 [Phaeomoniella chlamydospora]
MSLFNLGGNSSAQQSKPPFGAAQPAQSGSGLFGGGVGGVGAADGQQPQQSGSLFGSSQPQQSGGLFGQSTQVQSQPSQSGGFFGGFGQSTQQQSSQPTQSGGLFGGLGQNTQQQSQPQQSSGLFGGLGQSTQQNAPMQPGLFGGLGQSTQQPPQQQQQQQLGQSQAQPQLQFGQSTNQQDRQGSVKSLWEEGRGLGSIYRTIPAQIQLLAEKWNPASLSSPFRTYLYQKVDEQSAPFYQPTEGEDPDRWEEAMLKRPGPDYVPALARGFFEMGKRAQLQRQYIEYCQIRLHEINSSLDAQLQTHNQSVASRLAECRRKHVVASQRILALAAKIQILKSRGYAMDNAEEELKLKLEKLEREVFDPTVSGREQEIWARMIGIRERSKQLQLDIERTAPVANGDEDGLDEATIKAAKNALQAYDTQLRHLQKELKLVQDEFADWDSPGTNGNTIK